MRFVAEVTGKDRAESLVLYLLSHDIPSQANPVDESETIWDIWVRDEDQIEQAKTLRDQFLASPDSQDAVDRIAKIRKTLREQKSEERRQPKVQKGVRRGRYNPSLRDRRLPPITMTLILLCVIVSLVTDFFHAESRPNSFGALVTQQMRFVESEEYRESGDPAASLKDGELWRAITPIFLHGSQWHLLFNCVALFSFGRLLERMLGVGRYTFLILFTAIVSSVLQGLLPEAWKGSPNFGGISGVVYGLFGYLWIRTMFDRSLGFALAPGIVVIFLLWLFISFSGVIKTNLADIAHLAGMVSGGVLGYVAALPSNS